MSGGASQETSGRRLPSAVLALTALTCGCTSAVEPVSKPARPDAGSRLPTGDCTEDGWCWVHPTPTGATLTGVWGTSPKDLYLAASTNILHFDGHRWTTVKRFERTILDLWGWSSSAIYVSGDYWLERFYGGAWTGPKIGKDPRPFRAVWGISATDVVAVGSGGTVVRFRKDTVSVVQPGVKADYTGVWGAAGVGYFLVGKRGVIHRLKGGTLSPMNSGSTANHLNGVWGASATEVFAVGTRGAALRFDGSAWTPMTINTKSSFFDVWGSSGTDVFAVGTYGSVARHDGKGWTLTGVSPREHLHAVWGLGPTDVYAVGTYGLFLRYDGKTWRPEPGAGQAASSARFTALWGSSDTNIYAGYHSAVLRYDGQQWKVSGLASGQVNGLWGASPTEVYAATDRGAYGFDGTSWKAITTCKLPRPTFPLVGVWGSTTAAGLDVYFLNDNYLVALDPTTGACHSLKLRWSRLTAIWGSSATDVFVANDSGEIFHRDAHWGWDQMETGTTKKFHAIWGSDPSSVWAVGDGVLAYYDGKYWSHHGSGDDLWAVWGTGRSDVYAVGAKCVIRHFDGARWRLQGERCVWAIKGYRGVWGAGSSSVYVVGDDGTILRKTR